MEVINRKGSPTDAEVRILEDCFGVPEAGSEVGHADIEGLLKLDRGSSRYGSVVAAWRKKLLRDHNVDMGAVPGVGFRSLRPDERISQAARDAGSGLQKVVRAASRAARVPTEDPALTHRQNVLHRLGLAAKDELDRASKAVAFPAPHKALPPTKQP